MKNPALYFLCLDVKAYLISKQYVSQHHVPMQKWKIHEYYYLYSYFLLDPSHWGI